MLAVTESERNIRGEAEVQDTGDINIQIEAEANAKAKVVASVAGAVIAASKDEGVRAEVGPDGDLAANTQVDADEVKASAKADVGAQLQAELNLDIGGQIDVGTNGKGQSSSHEALERAANDATATNGNVNVVVSAERNVESGRAVDSSASRDNQVESESSAEISAKYGAETNGEFGGGDELNCLKDGSRGRQVNLEVTRESTQRQVEAGLLEELGKNRQTNGTLHLCLNKAQVKRDTSLSIDNAA
jgi:hypothetical protein